MSTTPNSAPSAPFPRLTVRPVLLSLSLFGSVAFVMVLMWAINTYSAFSERTRHSGIERSVQVLVDQRLKARHLPAVIDMARGVVGEPGLRD